MISDKDRALIRQDLADEQRHRNSDRPTQLIDFARWQRFAVSTAALLRENQQLRDQIAEQAAEIVRLSKGRTA